MARNIYAVRDTLANDIIGGLYLMPHDAVAVRFFGDAALDEKGPVSRHIEDFEMVCLGSVEDETLKIVALPAPEVVITGKQWKAAQPGNA